MVVEALVAASIRVITPTVIENGSIHNTGI